MCNSPKVVQGPCTLGPFIYLYIKTKEVGAWRAARAKRLLKFLDIGFREFQLPIF